VNVLLREAADAIERKNRLLNEWVDNEAQRIIELTQVRAERDALAAQNTRLTQALRDAVAIVEDFQDGLAGHRMAGMVGGGRCDRCARVWPCPEHRSEPFLDAARAVLSSVPEGKD
jgi:hypothetical protein